MVKWQAIVFDLDDTLYPEREYVLSGFRAVASWAATQLGIPFAKGSAELERLFRMGIRGNTFNQWLAMHNLDDSNIPQLVHIYRDHEPLLTPFPEVPALLENLRHTFRLGLLSDGYIGVQQKKLKALGLVGYFDAIALSDEWGRSAWKPSIVAFKAILQRLRTVPRSAVYVADNPLKDFLGARQIGMSTIRVHRPEGEYAQSAPPTPQHAPDFTITSLADLEKILIEDNLTQC